MKKILALIAVLLLVSVSMVLSQETDYCNGDFDCDTDVEGSDGALFKLDFGRGEFNNPCPHCPTDPWCTY